MMLPEIFAPLDNSSTNLDIAVQSCRRQSNGYWTIVGLVSGCVALPDGRQLVVNKEVHVGMVQQRGRVPYALDTTVFYPIWSPAALRAGASPSATTSGNEVIR